MKTLLLFGLAFLALAHAELSDADAEALVLKELQEFSESINKLSEDAEQGRSFESDVMEAVSIIKKLLAEGKRDVERSLVESLKEDPNYENLKKLSEEERKFEMDNLMVNAIKAKGFELMENAGRDEKCNCTGPFACKCCIRPAGLKRACLKMRMIPSEKKVHVEITYGDSVFMTSEMPAQHPAVECKQLPPPLGLIDICIQSGGAVSHKDGIRACFKVFTQGGDVYRCIHFTENHAQIDF